MTQSPHWPEHGAALKPFADTIDVGLHLTLVDEKPLTAMPRMAPAGRLPTIGQLIVKSCAGQLALDEIAREVDAQIAAFVAVMGRPPAHIDGHLHAHVLRGIRNIVFSAAERMTPRPWLRTVTDRGAFRRPSALKASILNVLGSRFTREASARGFVTNVGFSGFYDFAQGNYASRFPAFLRATGPRHLILCHPGEVGDGAAWSEARAGETAYLKGPTFEALLPSAQIVRLSAL